ncbi:TetR/AcrR family transcriptional regulator [Gordonia rhizosphera]|uniref:Putative TetR family transcriptional regulator n=1 Tax=Gordonia rhizosphera NBRC 16068 TaxID=1108045 RepID=K6W9L1_9ACTN|nr:TetR/AcrR family transcriptional regulator [Gordonia rhizosphera]GAB88892.1 putative TetR family transcriptional regulator [Gordonia rhizosphera NBRC 16068]
MGRWPTGSRERLQGAALALFVERGYDETSVADIAARAGVTERTFYRHFGDKREVLFDGGHSLENAIVESLASCPPDLPPLDAIGQALDHAAARFFDDPRLPFARERQSVIGANPELQERESLKMTSLTAAVSRCLQTRGSDETTARLAAEMGIGVFKVAFACWVAPGNTEPLTTHLRESLTRLRRVAGQ